MMNKEKSAKKARKHIPVKTSFTSPFSVKWSTLPPTDSLFILKTLKDKLISTGLEKKEVKVFRARSKKKPRGPKRRDPASTSEPDSQASKNVQVPDPIRNGWTDVAARRQLAVGINEVTKALERNELQLLLVCHSVRPPHMTSHLIALSVTRGVPACQVPHLSKNVSKPLGLKSVLALGFRRCPSTDNQLFRDVIDAIKPKVPSLHVTWLESASAKVTPEHPAGEEEEEETEVKRGLKRKLEHESEKDTESPSSSSSSSSSALQPLKVKRIVANPAKKKKVKPKKPAVK